MRVLAILGVVGGLAASALAACDGAVVVDASGTGGGGTTTSSSTSSSTTAPACYQTHDTFEMRLQTPGGAVWSCSDMSSQEGDLTFTAQVTAASGNALTLDACSPAADCMPMLHDLTFSASGLYSYIPIGSYVELSVHVERPWGCEHALQIRNVATWDGYPNPVYQDERVWLVAADGSMRTFTGTPFTVDRVALGCHPGQYGCNLKVPVDDYALVFDTGAGPVELLGGESTSLTVSSPVAQLFYVRNLRSYQPLQCDDDWNWAYFAVQDMGLD
ncbi:MAG: hypothetical protein IT373_01525 [Polyangiaceae bacterium]|nr:hypothetical protein [Polyangiaceae bacterium]